MIVSGSADETIRLWKIDNKGNFKLYKTLQGHNQSINSVAFSPEGTILISGSTDMTIRLWDTEGNLIGQPLQGHKESILSVAFSPDGETIVTGSEDSKLGLWDIKGNFIGQPLRGHEGIVYSAAFSPNGEIIASGGAKGRLCFLDTKGNLIGKPLQSHQRDNKYYSINSVAFSPDGKILASGGDDGTVCLWDIKGNPIGERLQDHEKKSVNSVAFSPDGKILASGDEDGTVCLWDVQKKSLIHNQIWCKDNTVNCVTFSPDGKTIACALSDKTIRVWYFEVQLWYLESQLPKYEIKNWSGHNDEVNSIVFSPDGQMAVSGSLDGTLRLWDIKGTPIMQQPWCGHEGKEVSCVAFSPDGKVLVSSSIDGTIRLWRVGWQAWLKVCCDRLASLALKEPDKFISEDQNCEICARYGIWSQTDYVEILIKQGAILAHRKKREESVVKFEQAQKYDKKSSSNLDTQAKRCEQEKENQVNQEQVDVEDQAFIWNNICWYGSLYGFHEKSYVKDACEKAIKAKPDEKSFRDCRGFNRALNNNFEAAIEDFEAFINSNKDNSKKLVREEWVSVLRNGENPFTEEEINKIIKDDSHNRHLRNINKIW